MYDARVRFVSTLLVLAGLSCVPVSAPVPVTEVQGEARARADKRVIRENRALRREVRALRQELSQARAIAESESQARRREGEVQSAIVAGLAEQIRVLARTIGDLEAAMRAQATAAQQPRTQAKQFGKLRVGSVPAQSPTLPEPRDRMDQPDRGDGRPPDLLDPFTKAPTAATP